MEKNLSDNPGAKIDSAVSVATAAAPKTDFGSSNPDPSAAATPIIDSAALQPASNSEPVLVDDPVAASQTFQNVALGVVACAALIWFLKFAESVFVPILLGLILSYSLRPFVDWLQRTIYIPRMLGAAVLLLLLFGGVGAGLWNLRADVAAVAGDLPKAARMIREFVGTPQAGTQGLMSDIRRAARELDQASAALSIDTTTEKKTASSVTVAPAAPAARATSVTEHLQNFLGDRVGKVVGVATTLSVAGLLAYLLLCAGTEHRKNLLQIVGQSLSRKKVTLTILNEIHSQVQYYLAATAATNVALALSTWALFAYFGIERALLWGIIAGLLHLVPYLGTGLFLIVSFVIGLVALGGFWPAFYLTIIWLMIEFIIGFGLTNYIQSRSSRINSAALFVGFLVFGWLWGGWGLVVAAPVLAAVKAVSDRVPSLKEISTLLS